MRRIPLLIAIFTVAVLVVAAVIMGLLYRAALNQEAALLAETANSQARTIESIARHEEQFARFEAEPFGHGDALAATLAQLRDANNRFGGFGRTGELSLARREGDSIVYLLNQRHPSSRRTEVIPFNGPSGEPMRRALSGRTGTVIGPDYRGVTVLAAHTPVNVFGMGVVAKIDLAEVQAPFVRAGLISIAVALVTVLLGSLLFYLITNPVLRQLQESETRLKNAQALAHLGSWTLDQVKNELAWSDEVYRIFGLQPQEFGATYEAFLAAVHPDDRAVVDAAYSDSVRENRDGYEIEHRVVRKDTGEVRIVEEKCEHVRNAFGRIIRSAGMVHDITERKRAEEALREAHAELEQRAAELQAVLDVAPVAVWIAHDPQCLRITGNACADELIMRVPRSANISASARPGDAAVTFRVFRAGVELKPEGMPAQVAAATGKPVAVEALDLVFADGRVVHMVMGAKPLLDADGRVRGAVAAGADITQLTQAEEALRVSEERYRNLFSTMEEGFCIIEVVFDAENRPVDYRFLEVNAAFEGQTGLRDATGKLMRDLAPDHEAYWFEIYGKVALTGEPVRFDNEAKALNRWYDVHAYRVGRPEDRRVAILFSDISDIKRAEQALREAKESLEVKVKERTAELTAEVEERRRAEERLAAASQYVRSLIESSLDPLVTISGEGKITDVNEATVKATGVLREQLIGTDFSDYFAEPEKARDGYQQVFAKGFVTDFPLTIRQRDGHLTDVLYNASVYRDTRGSVIGVFAAARDVTAQKQASQYARSLIESSLDPLVTISADGKITDVNEATVKVTGLPRGRLIGTDFSDYFTEPEKAREGYRQVFAKGFVTDYPLTICHRDGRLTDVLYNASVYKDSRGNIVGVFAAARDVTDRKRAEQALQKAHDTLEVRVAERTAELKRSNEELEQFAYVASHDLQQPLRMVASYVELLGQRYKGRLDEKADKYIAYASGGAIRMHQLVNDLLAYSRVGTRAAPPAPVSLDRVVAQARENLTVAIEESDAMVEADPLPVVAGDEIQLVQLFQNLLDNAVKFRSATPPKVSVTCRDAGTEWEFAVRDNGIGIDPKHAERIFGVFKRLHTEQEYPGTGIGLALCRKIVERHGGRIHVEPAEGGGSVFRFTLPKRPAAMSPEPAGATT